MEVTTIKKPYNVFETIDVSQTSYEFKKFMAEYLNDVVPYNYSVKKKTNPPFTFLRRAVIIKSHVGLCFSEKMDFLESITNMKRNEVQINSNNETSERNKIWIASELDVNNFPERVPFLHLTLNTYEYLPLFHQQLKFVFQISGTLFFHVKYQNINSFTLGGYNILQSLFINAIQYSKNVAFTKTELIIIAHDSNLDEDREYLFEQIKEMIELTWEKSLSYLGLNEKTVGFKLHDLFLIWDIFRFGSKKYHLNFFESQMQGIKKFLKDTQILGLEIDLETIERMEFRKLINIKNFENSCSNAWLKGRHIDFIPIRQELLPLNFVTKAFCSNYMIEVVFDVYIFLEITKTIKKWYSITEKGLYISDFGNNFKKLVQKVKQEKNKLVKSLQSFNKHPKEASQGGFYTKREINLINEYINRIWIFLEIHTKRIWVLQIKMLQYRCSEIYKKKILKLLIQDAQKWDNGKEKALNETEEIFMGTAKGHTITLLGKDIEPAKVELRKVLEEFTRNIKESPAAELQGLDRIDREVQTMGLKTRSIMVGLGLTAALRLRGYGNFQLITSYAFGPHVFNFSCINDRDTLENEKGSFIKPFRIQPSLNFDIRL